MTMAPSMKSTPRTLVARVRTVAPARAPNAGLAAAAAAEGARHVAALALLQEYHEQQHQAGENGHRVASK